MAQEIQPAKGNHKECCDSGGCTTHAKNHSVVSTPRTPAEASIDTIYKACAYGDVDKLHQFVEANPALIGTPDPQGYHCLQWGALNNRVAVCSYLIEKGADVNAIDKAGQTALHWAAVRGSLAAAETILRANGNIEIADSRGYTVCHVAAQYGQSKFIYHVSLHWQADFEKTDKDGRTSLHWAAYKGFGDIIRLLIFMDAHVDLTDKEGCTPLHWAAIVGNGEAATLLLQGGSVDLLNSRDVTGSTPWELATEKGHRFLGMHLKEWKEKHKTNGLFGKKGALGWVTSTQLCPIIWVLILGLLLSFVFTVINTPAFPRVTASVALWAYSVLGFAFTGLYFLYKTTTTDPGFIPKGTEDAHGNGGSSRVGDLTNTYDNPALRAGNWQQLCVTCKIVRPLRAKHCAVTDRCVEHFDHYCPWVGNCIGKGNRHLFFIFLALETYALLVSAAIAILRVHDQAGHPQQWRVPGMHWTIVFIVVDLFILISVVALTISQGVQIAKNVTTNEMANWYRYKYLKRPDGTYRNPFDKGLVRNCMEVLVPNMKSRTPVLIEDPADLESGQLLAKTDDRRTA